MTRSITALLLILMLIPAFLLPATVNALDCDTMSINICSQMMPVTQITSSTAEFTGILHETYRVLVNGQNENPINAWVFEYSIKPGIYPYSVIAIPYDFTTSQERIGDYLQVQTNTKFKATVQDLEPCNTYYVRLIRHGTAFWAGLPCITVCDPNVVKFYTAGCTTGLSGSGSIGTSTVTPSSTSPLPVSAPVQMANIAVQSATITATKVSPGQNLDIAATVTNKGTASGDAKLTLYVNGEAVDSKGVTVASGQTVPVHFNVSRSEPGTYDVYVNGTPAGSFTVDVFTNNDNLVYGIIALLLLGVAGTLFFLLRKRTA